MPDPRTGKNHGVDRGLEPAGASASGQDRGRGLRRLDYEEIEGLDPAAGTEAVRKVLNEPSPALREFFRQVRAHREEVFPGLEKVERLRIEDQAVKDRIGYVPVSFLGDRARDTLPPPLGEVRPARLVRLSPETAVKQLIKHQNIDVDDYRLLPDLIELGEMFEDEDANCLMFFRRFNGKWHKAVVKQTSNNELFLTTFHRLRRRQLPRVLQIPK